MVKLPDFTALGNQGPQASTIQPNIPSSDPRYTAMEGLGNTLQAVGGQMLAIQKQKNDEALAQQNAVDVPNAVSYMQEAFQKGATEAESDPNYSKLGDNAAAYGSTVLANAGKLIRDPKKREQFLASARQDVLSYQARIADFGVKLSHQQDQGSVLDSLERFRRIIVDPKSTPEAAKKAQADLEGSLQVAQQAQIFTPEQARDLRQKNIDDSYPTKLKLGIAEGKYPVGAAHFSPQVETVLQQKAAQYGVPVDVARAMVQIESGGNPNAHNASGASGLFQFIPDTWKTYGNGKSVYDVEANIDAGMRFTRDNIAKLRGVLGRDPTPGEIYLAHFGGPARFEKIAKASDNTPVTKLFGEPAVKANPNLQGGTTVGELKAWADKKMSGGGSASSTPGYQNDPAWSLMSPEQQYEVTKFAEQEQNRGNAELRTQIEIASQNGPAAMQNTGSYSGYQPSAADFTTAYGAQKGAQEYAQFQASMATAGQIHDFQTQPNDQIMAAVRAAEPTSTGDNAAIETARYNTMAAAAQHTLEARAADPASYVMHAFPNVNQKWQAVRNGTGTMQEALAASGAAETQIGIPSQQQALLPKDMADSAVATFKDVNQSTDNRIAAVMQPIMATNDPVQQESIKEQLFLAGLPAIADGAIRASMRPNDTGASRRLWQAALTNVSELPGKVEESTDDIKQGIQDGIMGPGSVGDAYYGVANGTAGNFTRANRDNQLMQNYVNLRLREGYDLSTAVDMVKRDLFGDVKPLQDTHAHVLIDGGADAGAYRAGFAALQPKVRATLEAAKLATLAPTNADRASGYAAVLDASTQKKINETMAWGWMQNLGNGFGWVEPMTSTFVTGPDHKPIIFSDEDVLKAAGGLTRSGPARTIGARSFPGNSSVTGGSGIPGLGGGAGNDQLMDFPSEKEIGSLKLSPQEQNLYDHHLTNMKEGKTVMGHSGMTSTIFMLPIHVGSKWFAVPKVWDGRIITDAQAYEKLKEDPSKWPAYHSKEELNARYDKMHAIMEKDVSYLEDHSEKYQWMMEDMKQSRGKSHMPPRERRPYVAPTER